MSQAVTAHYDDGGKTSFGFWVYLMTDLVLFASLFATFAVLRNNTAGGPGGDELFSMPYVLAETMILLVSSFTCGLAVLAARAGKRMSVVNWLIVTAILGLAFLGMEINEFATLAHEGNSWTRSGFLSAFFTLVGTHGAHITVGLIWMSVMMVQIWRRGLGGSSLKRLGLMSMFWHFLDVVWIFIFTIVFLMGRV